MARGRKTSVEDHPEGMMARAGGVARDNPVAAGGAVVMALTGCLIIANAVSLQPGRHPAPLFTTRDRPVAVEPEDRRGIEVQQISTLVLDLQKGLRRHGLYEGPLDGLMGPATERAIRHYERLQGQLETGEATEGLLALLTLQGTETGTYAPSEAGSEAQSASATMVVPRPKPGSYDRSLRSTAPIPPAAIDTPPSQPVDTRLARIQQLLSDLGYGPLSADGVMGANTSSAIQRFQLDRGLPITGELSPAVIERLEMVSGQKID